MANQLDFFRKAKKLNTKFSQTKNLPRHQFLLKNYIYFFRHLSGSYMYMVSTELTCKYGLSIIVGTQTF